MQSKSKNLKFKESSSCHLGALVGSEGTWPMEQSTLKKAWAQVGQVDLFQTNIDEK